MTDLDLFRRRFLLQGTMGLGAAALSSIASAEAKESGSGTGLTAPHFAARAKRVIYIFQAGGPAQMELYDHKPQMAKYHGQELPPSIRDSQRLTGFTKGQGKFPVVASPFYFRRRGASGATFSDLLPHLSGVADDLCFVKTVHTEAVNHDPGVTFMLTGAQQPGRPCLGSWLSYGVGSESQDLPAFVVLLTPGLIQDASTPLSSRHWGSGFLPANHQGVKLRPGKDSVLYLSNPPGIDRKARLDILTVTNQLNRLQKRATGNPEIEARIRQYELAYRMQSSMPRLSNIAAEPTRVLDSYGPQVKIPGTYAANCLLARRLVEEGVRFVQIFDRDWDHHRNAPQHMKTKAKSFDQPTAALIRDLKRRGMLDDTLIVCGGEFGRTAYCQGPMQANYGRDHHGGCFTMWFAGGGVKGGYSYGETDDFSFTVKSNPVHIHDIQATILACLGIDHKRLTFKHQSREFRLTDVSGKVIREILA